ncbi:leucyl aminopeptidase [Microbacterium murale]|uniref:Probable cytosol aminopeptidase n=1 Tax=Microbacterium murale TaxID=1081040 RepID=A0ABU0P703_9MICO|nr:leucyl aminopeptidase [Microbacterium murale]MDQ0642717.1 leucyl aminopeptidase [Microbacterium murale]
MTTTLPRILLEPGDPAELVVDVLVVALENRADSIEVRAPLLAEAAQRSLREAALAVGHRAKREATARIPAPPGVSATSVLFVGLGDTGGASQGADFRNLLRRAAGSALRSLNAVDSVALAFPVGDAEDAETVATGALLGAYRYTAYQSDASGRTIPATLAISAAEAVRPALERAAVIAAAVAATRDLVNRPPSDLFPESFADAVVSQALVDDLKDRVNVEVIDEAELEERGFGGLLGVGRGSARGPRLVKVSYGPAASAPLLSLVGKGITFDSGGISLKPAARMENMKSDMAGAAAAVQSLFAIARLRLPLRVTAWLALAENMPSGSAVRPADVLRIHGGKTVEVTNTDAEGRLVLADALVAAQEEDPDLLVDIATLTGAQVAALGRRTSGVMGTQSARERVTTAAESAGEPMWAMPIPEEMIGYFDSHTADLKNAGAPAGGMLAAAAFLREFVRDGVEWAHLDIAGPAYNSDSPYGHTVVGGTGVPVRTIVELALSMTR